MFDNVLKHVYWTVHLHMLAYKKGESKRNVICTFHWCFLFYMVPYCPCCTNGSREGFAKRQVGQAFPWLVCALSVKLLESREPDFDQWTSRVKIVAALVAALWMNGWYWMFEKLVKGFEFNSIWRHRAFSHSVCGSTSESFYIYSVVLRENISMNVSLQFGRSNCRSDSLTLIGRLRIPQDSLALHNNGIAKLQTCIELMRKLNCQLADQIEVSQRHDLGGEER